MIKRLLNFVVGLVFIAAQVHAQQRTLTGKVTSAEDGEPLPGVSVKIKGSPTGTSTGAQGTFSIQASPGQVITFSFIGATTVERTVGTSSTINVVLESSSAALNEVVVTGQGVNRDSKSLGYSVPTVKGDEVAQTQRADFFGGLQGRVPGLSINSTSGNPGASAQIVLRGFVSISGDNNALIVVDGVPVDNSILNENQLGSVGTNQDRDYSNGAMNISPEDIESYSIMKGPEATALYGSSGASGAIIITTKKGKAGKGTINYSGSVALQKVNRFPLFQQKYNSGQNGVFASNTTIYGGPAFVEGTQIYDNAKEFFQVGVANNHSLSFEGGTDKFSYRWSNQYYDEDGTVPTTSYKRLTSTVTGVGTISRLLKLTSTFSFTNSDNVKANKGLNGYMVGLSRFNSSYDINNWKDENGNRRLYVGSIYSEMDNPLWDVYKNTNEDSGTSFRANTNLQFTPTNWLTITAIGGANITNTEGMRVYHPQSYRGSGSDADPTGGFIETYERTVRILNATANATARHSFGRFNNTYIIGADISNNEINVDSQRGEQFFDADFKSINNTLPTSQRSRNVISQVRKIGAFGQAVLGYESLVFLTLGLRMDGASKLMPNNPYFVYPLTSLAFNFTEIQSIANAMPWLNYGKFRASVALTGKEPWREYSTGSNLLGKSSTGGGFLYDYYGGNPDLKPEKSTNFETGFELQFLKNRIGVDFTYYSLRSDDQIINPRLSYGSGFVLRLMNGGSVVNKGVEVQLNVNPIKRSSFNYDFTVNFSRNRGKVLSIAEELPELYDSDTWLFTGVRSAVHPGYSTTAISGNILPRNDNGDLLINPATGLPVTSTDTKYYPIGDRNPKFTMGLVNRFRYKNLSLSFLWDLRYGGDVLNGTEYLNYTRMISLKTLDREVPRIIKGVLQDGLDNTANPTPNTIAVTPYLNSNYYTTNVGPEMFVERNIKALRLRDVTFNFTFPKSTLSKLKFVESLGAFVTFRDLVLISNYSGMDPESNANTPALGGVGGYGIDNGNIGKPIGMNLGLRLKL